MSLHERKQGHIPPVVPGSRTEEVLFRKKTTVNKTHRLVGLKFTEDYVHYLNRSAQMSPPFSNHQLMH